MFSWKGGSYRYVDHDRHYLHPHSCTHDRCRLDDMEEPPKTINAMYGYRTKMSSLNQNTWRFSQEYAGRLWVRWGIRMMPVSILLLMFCAAAGEKAAAIAGSVLCIVQIVIMLSSIAVVERMLKKVFDKQGNLKQ